MFLLDDRNEPTQNSFAYGCTVLSGRYTESCDLWSMGVVLYMLVSGVPPFWGNSDAEIRGKILKGAFSYPPQSFKVHAIPTIGSPISECAYSRVLVLSRC
jgi:serine/threonine protein kinase